MRRGPERSFVLSAVDEPRAGVRLLPGTVLRGSGWAVGAVPIAEITVRLGDLLLGYAQYGQPRPEIGRDFPDYPQSAHAGFVFAIPLGPEVGQARGADLAVCFRTQDGAESRRHVGVNWAAAPVREAEARPWPIRLALDECRVDAAGRLVVRGWAVARTALSGLALYLNDGLLDAPERGLARPDIAARYPGYAEAGRCGFRLLRQVAPPPARSVVRVVARAGDVQRQIIVPLGLGAGGQAGKSGLSADGLVSLCCESLTRLADGVVAIGGWAVSDAGVRAVELRAGGRGVGMAELGLHRPDIGNRFPRLPGARQAGFRLRSGAGEAIAAGAALSLIVHDMEGGEQVLALRAPADAHEGAAPEGAGEAEGGSMLAASARDVIEAAIDTPELQDGVALAPVRERLMVAGWAVSASGIAAVEVWADERLLGRAFLGVRREDVAAAHPDMQDALTAGFALTLPQRRLGPGEHALRVLIRARSGAQREELLRVVLEPEADARLGAIRRVVPAGETWLRMALLERYGAMPRVSVVIRPGAPGTDARGRAATLESLRRQSLAQWRAVVVLPGSGAGAEPGGGEVVGFRPGTDMPAIWPEAAPADWDLLCVVRAGDRLGADALMTLALTARQTGADFVYADERAQDADWVAGGVAGGVAGPFFKPGWSADLLHATNYIGRSWCATRALVERARLDLGRIARLGDYDLVLRLTEAARQVAHVPQCLFDRAGRRLEPARREQQALAGAARRSARGAAGGAASGAVPEAGAVAGTWRMRRGLPARAVVSVVMATCGSRELVRLAITSLRQSADWPLEIIVLDDIPAGNTALKAWVAAQADRVIAVSGPFNWSAMNNLGAAVATGAWLLFLNDDTECTEPGWLHAMLEHAQRPEVGVVGPMLTYPDGKLQHAGMILRGREARHLFRFADPAEPGPFGLAAVARQVSAVTGACLLTRRAVFEALGGFDADHGVIMNDVDYCLRAWAAGLRTIYTPHARLVHHEMASRVALGDRFDAARFDAAWGVAMLAGDAWFNPNLARDSDDMLVEAEPVEWVQPGVPLLDLARVRRVLVLHLPPAAPGFARAALRCLRTGFADARIILAADAAGAAMAVGLGLVDDVVVVDDRAVETLGPRLRAVQADVAVDLRPPADSRPLLRASGAPVLAGFDHGGRFGWLDLAVEWDAEPPLVDKRSHVSVLQARLAGALVGAAGAYVADGARTGPGDVTGDGTGWFICIDAAGSALTRWPEASFNGLIRLLQAGVPQAGMPHAGVAAAGLAVRVLAGSPAGVGRGLADVGVVDGGAAGPSLAGCALYVGNDGPGARQAAQAGIPTVVLAASHVDPAEWGPVGERVVVLRRRMSCGPCYITEAADCGREVTCLRGITPAEAYRACRLLLGFTTAVCAI